MKYAHEGLRTNEPYGGHSQRHSQMYIDTPYYQK